MGVFGGFAFAARPPGVWVVNSYQLSALSYQLSAVNSASCKNRDISAFCSAGILPAISIATATYWKTTTLRMLEARYHNNTSFRMGNIWLFASGSAISCQLSAVRSQVAGNREQGAGRPPGAASSDLSRARGSSSFILSPSSPEIGYGCGDD